MLAVSILPHEATAHLEIFCF